MANSVTIPQDIIDNIIEAVGYDKHLLKQCALVSSSFLLPSRKQLFSRIFLINHLAYPRLHQFLVQNPVIRSFVRSITIIQHSSDCRLDGTLLAILRLPFCCLECFSITSYSWNWNSFSSELKDALSNIIHSSTLKTLSLTYIVNVPITLFLGIVHLTKLELYSVSFNHFDGKQSSSLIPAASKAVTTMASHMVLDQCVWYFRLREQMCGPTEPIFLPFLCRLRFFEINVESFSTTMRDVNILSFLMRSLCVSLTSPATLEHLKFKLTFEDEENSSDYSAFYEDLRDADVWSHLVSVITHPIGSRIQRVDINIRYTFRYGYNVTEPDDDEILEAVLDGLPLLREKGILFVKAAVG